MTQVRIVDETFGAPDDGGRRAVRGTLSLDLDCTTMRNLIRLRVEDEMASSADRITFLRELCGEVPGEQVTGDRGRASLVEAAIRRAWDGFDAGDFLVLVNDLQAASLDDPVPLEDVNEAIFLRILPLQGG